MGDLIVEHEQYNLSGLAWPPLVTEICVRRVDRSVTVNGRPVQTGRRKRGSEDGNHVDRVGPVGRAQDVGQAGDPRQLRGDSCGRRPEGTGNAARAVQTAEMGGAEKRAPVLGRCVGDPGKTAETVRGCPREVFRVDDHGAEREDLALAGGGVR